jgi:hypothetical protein
MINLGIGKVLPSGTDSGLADGCESKRAKREG